VAQRLQGGWLCTEGFPSAPPASHHPPPLCTTCCTDEEEPPAVPEDEALAGDAAAAYFRVTVLEEELRVMAPDLGAIEAYR
jgi:hypothetical protein